MPRGQKGTKKFQVAGIGDFEVAALALHDMQRPQPLPGHERKHRQRKPRLGELFLFQAENLYRDGVFLL